MTWPPAVYDLPRRALGPNATRLVFASAVLEVFCSQRQLKPFQVESGGQLFGKFANEVVMITVATAPSPDDHRSRFRFKRSLVTEQAEIDREFSNGLHYLGDWHTHPELKPRPSCTDCSVGKRLFRTSRHQLPNFLMVIIGVSDKIDDMYVALINGRRISPLKAISTR